MFGFWTENLLLLAGLALPLLVALAIKETCYRIAARYDRERLTIAGDANYSSDATRVPRVLH